MSVDTGTVPTTVLARFCLSGATLTPIAAGHLNATFAVVHGERRFVLQRLNKIFGEEIHEDIEAVTRHLAKKGLTTPLLVPTEDGALFAREDGTVYRVFTYVPDTVTNMKATSPALCASAGEFLGKFHTALADLGHTFKNKRGNIHDTPKHVAKLRAVLASHTGHERYGDVAPTCRRILERIDALPPLTGLPRRVVHGDPKISNVLFDKNGRALCLVDLDTLGPANVAVELGDALRSWCNPREEDDAASSIDLGFFEAAVQAYLSGAASFITPGETAMIAIGVETIALELAARFAADALEESYFGWDRSRFSRASEHNLARAVGQLAVAVSMHAQRDQAIRLLR